MMLPFPPLRLDGSQLTPPLKVTHRVQLSVQSQPVSSTNSLASPSTVSPSLAPVNPVLIGGTPLVLLPSVTLSPQLVPPFVNLRIPPFLSLNQSCPHLSLGPPRTLPIGPQQNLLPFRTPQLSLIGPPPVAGNSQLPQGTSLQLTEVPDPTNQEYLVDPGLTSRLEGTVTIIQETSCELDMNRGFPMPVTPYGVAGRDMTHKSMDTLLDGSKKEFMITRAEKVSLWRTFAEVFHEKPTERLDVTDKALLAIFVGLPSHIRRAIRHKGGIGAVLRECPWFQVIGDTVQLVPSMEKLYQSQEDDVKEASSGEKHDGDVPDSWEDLCLSDIDEGGYRCLPSTADDDASNQSIPNTSTGQDKVTGRPSGKDTSTLTRNRENPTHSSGDKHSNDTNKHTGTKNATGLKWSSSSKEFIPLGAPGRVGGGSPATIEEVWDEVEDEDMASVARFAARLKDGNKQIFGRVGSSVVSPSTDQGSEGIGGSSSGVPDNWETLDDGEEVPGIPRVSSIGLDDSFGKESWDDSLYGIAVERVREDKEHTGTKGQGPPRGSVPCPTKGCMKSPREPYTGLTFSKSVPKSPAVIVDICNNLVDLGPSADEGKKSLVSLDPREDERLKIEREILESLKVEAWEKLSRGSQEQVPANRGVAVSSQTGTQTVPQGVMVDVSLDCSGLIPRPVTTGVNTDPVRERMECFDHCKRALACCKSELQKVTSEQSEAEGRLTLLATKLKIKDIEYQRLKAVNQQLHEAQQKPPTADKTTLTDVDLFLGPIKKMEHSLSEAKQRNLVSNLKNIDLQAKLAYQLISQAYEESEIIVSMTKTSLARKATLTTQVMKYQSGLLSNKEEVDKWKQTSERILTTLRSADTLPPFPHVDIAKFTPDLKPVALLRQPNNPPLSTTVNLAANFDGPKEPLKPSKKRTMEEAESAKAPPCPPAGFKLATSSTLNPAKVHLSSTFLPNERSDRPGTATIEVSQEAVLSPHGLIAGSHQDGNQPTGVAYHSSVSGSYHGPSPLGKNQGGRTLGQSERPAAANGNFAQPGQTAYARHPPTLQPNRDNQQFRPGHSKNSLPSDAAILGFGPIEGTFPPTPPPACFPPYMMPVYPPPMDDPTILFGKIDQMIETFAQDSPPNFGSAPQVPFGPTYNNCDARPREVDEMRGTDNSSRRFVPQSTPEHRVDRMNQMIGQMPSTQERASSPFERQRGHERYHTAVSSKYGPSNLQHGTMDGFNRSTSMGQGPAGQERAPSPYERNPHAELPGRPMQERFHSAAPSTFGQSSQGGGTADGWQHNGPSQRREGAVQERSPSPYETRSTPSPYTPEKATPMNDYGHTHDEQRVPSPYERCSTPSPRGVGMASSTNNIPNPAQEVPRAPAAHQMPSVPVSSGLPRSVFQGKNNVEGPLKDPSEVNQRLSPADVPRAQTRMNSINREVEDVVTRAPYPSHSLPGIPEYCQVLKDSVTKLDDGESSIEGISKSGSLMEEEPLLGAVGSPPTIGVESVTAAAAGSSPGKAKVPGIALFPEDQKVSFNKSTIRPPSKISKKSVRSNLGLDTFENEVPRRGRLAQEWMRGVSAVQGETGGGDDGDTMEGWLKPENKREKRAISERRESKITKTAAATAARAGGDAATKPATVVEDDYIPPVFSLTHLLKKLSQMFPGESSKSLTSAILKVRANHRGQLDNVHFNVVIAEVVTVLTSRAPETRDRKPSGESDREEPPPPSKPHQSQLPKLLAKLEEKFPAKERTELIKGIVQVRKAHDGTLAGISMVQMVVEVSQYLNSLDCPPDQHDDKNSCTICLGSLDSAEAVRKLECEHRFHDECIQCWFQKRERTCPMCRSHALLQDDFPRLPGARKTPGVKRI